MHFCKKSLEKPNQILPTSNQFISDPLLTSYVKPRENTHVFRHISLLNISIGKERKKILALPFSK
jgi:hypothetical protein